MTKSGHFDQKADSWKYFKKLLGDLNSLFMYFEYFIMLLDHTEIPADVFKGIFEKLHSQEYSIDKIEKVCSGAIGIVEYLRQVVAHYYDRDYADLFDIESA